MITIEKLFYREGSECYLCGEETIFPRENKNKLAATIDHIVPVSRGGQKSAIRNLAIACEECNQLKADMTLHEFIYFKINNKFAASYVEYIEDRARKRHKKIMSR